VNVKLRSSGRFFRFVAPSLMVVASAAAIVVWTRTDITATGYRIGRLIDQERALRTEVEKLRIEATALASPERIERGARAQGLTDPKPGQIVPLRSVGAAPDPGEARP
jgi:cell division protein FtsL